MFDMLEWARVALNAVSDGNENVLVEMR